MKKILISAALTAAFTLLAACGASAPGSAEDNVADEKAIAASVKNMNLVIEINRIIPTALEEVSSNSTYLLTFADGKMNGVLPFIGECYKIAHGGDMELIFEDSPYTEISRRHVRETGSYDLKLQAKSRNSEAFDIFLSVTESGYVNISFSTSGRSRISYYGLLRTGN